MCKEDAHTWDSLGGGTTVRYLQCSGQQPTPGALIDCAACQCFRRDKIILLNRTTEVINTWQAEGDARPSLDVVRAEFPDCTFMGTSTPAPPPPPPAYTADMAVSA